MAFVREILFCAFALVFFGSVVGTLPTPTKAQVASVEGVK